MNPLPSWVLREHEAYAGGAYQREPGAFRCMVTHHHPFAGDYKAARQAFDQLPFAAGAGYRYFSAIDECNYSVVSAPAIGISDGGWPPAHRYLVEAHQDHQAYCEQAVCEATAGWPSPEKYFLNHGEWHIFTTDRDVIREAQVLGMQIISLPTYHQCRQPYCDAETMAAIQQLVSRYHAGHLLLQELAPRPVALEPLETLCGQIRSGKDAWL